MIIDSEHQSKQKEALSQYKPDYHTKGKWETTTFQINQDRGVYANIIVAISRSSNIEWLMCGCFSKLEKLRDSSTIEWTDVHLFRDLKHLC